MAFSLTRGTVCLLPNRGEGQRRIRSLGPLLLHDGLAFDDMEIELPVRDE